MSIASRLYFRFSGNERSGNNGSTQHFIEGRHVEMANNIMNQGRNSNQLYFNDLIFYESLLEKEGCCSAEISSLRIRHNQFCNGIQVVYRLTFVDGRTEKYNGPENFFSNGYYSYHGGKPIIDTWVHLEEEEIITGIRINQGDILDGLTFVTDRREIFCGGNGGKRYDTMVTNPPSTRIVAFSGTACGVWQRVGYYAKSFAWMIIGPYILLRNLTIQGRATIATDASSNRMHIFGNIMEGLLNSLDDDVFRIVMKYLA